MRRGKNFVINIYEKLNLCGYLNICVFASASEIGALILYFTKLIQKKALKSILNVFVFFIKTSCQGKESPLYPTPPFLEKIFHRHPYCQIGGTQSPLYKERGSNYVSTCK